MIYRLRVILDNDTNEDVLRDIEIDKNSNLTDLHELILLSFNFSADQMASFYTVDEEWNQINEISLMNFDESTDSMDKEPQSKWFFFHFLSLVRLVFLKV